MVGGELRVESIDSTSGKSKISYAEIADSTKLTRSISTEPMELSCYHQSRRFVGLTMRRILKPPLDKKRRHEMGIVVYEKLIGSSYYYVEEIRTGKRSLAFQTLYKRTTKNPSDEGL